MCNPLGPTWVAWYRDGNFKEQSHGGAVHTSITNQLHQILSPKAEARKPLFRSEADAVVPAAGQDHGQLTRLLSTAVHHRSHTTTMKRPKTRTPSVRALMTLFLAHVHFMKRRFGEAVR